MQLSCSFYMFKDPSDFLTTQLTQTRERVAQFAEDSEDLRQLFKLAFLELGRREHDASMSSITDALSTL